MATFSQRFLLLSFLSVIVACIIIIIWRRVVTERAIESLDIFVLRIWAALSLPQKWRQNDHIVRFRRGIRGQRRGFGSFLLPRLEVKPNDPH